MTHRHRRVRTPVRAAPRLLCGHIELLKAERIDSNAKPKSERGFDGAREQRRMSPLPHSAGSICRRVAGQCLSSPLHDVPVDEINVLTADRALCTRCASCFELVELKPSQELHLNSRLQPACFPRGTILRTAFILVVLNKMWGLLCRVPPAVAAETLRLVASFSLSSHLPSAWASSVKHLRKTQPRLLQRLLLQRLLLQRRHRSRRRQLPPPLHRPCRRLWSMHRNQNRISNPSTTQRPRNPTATWRPHNTPHRRSMRRPQPKLL